MNIEMAGNGYIVTDTDEDGDETKTVFEENDGDPLAAWEVLLWHIIEQFGMVGSRYDKERLAVRREPGDKYNDGKDE